MLVLMVCLSFKSNNLYLIQHHLVKFDPTVLKIRVQHGQIFKMKVAVVTNHHEENYTVDFADSYLLLKRNA